jgi:hypothetical protein
VHRPTARTRNPMPRPRTPWIPLATGLLLALAMGSLGCPRPPPAQGPDAGSFEAGPVDAGPVDAGSQSPGDRDGGAEDAGSPGLEVLLWVAVDGGLEPVPLTTGASPVLEVTRQLFLEVRPQPTGLRIRLFDPADQVVESDDVSAATDGGVRYQLGLLEALRPGRAYTLVLDAEHGGDLTDGRGRAMDDVRIVLQVRGEPTSESRTTQRRKRR